MNFEYIFPILKGVLLNPFVIGTAIVIILYCNFMGYVADAAPAPKTEGKEAENSREPEEE